jgi:serine/threonine-protein kinase
MVRCRSCSRECADDSRFCPQCAKPLDATSAETEVLGTPSAPRLSSQSSVDEGRFLPGTVVAGRYRIAGLLGRGGMGEVYRATDLTLGQAVALKFLPETLSRDDRALARFYNEVRTARQVTHPNVCRVYDIGETEGLHYISMEFVDGEDLGLLLRRIGRLPVDKAVETAQKLCAGLTAAHEKGVLHRDLKPANVMIDGRGQVIIMDFGLAGLAGQLQSDIRSGTPAYMSPEQLAGTEVTARSDIYALGLVLYEVFTGRRAFEASSLMELLQMQERAAPAGISTVVKDIDPAVERAIMRCLAPDPSLRPASARAVAAALPGGDPLAAAMAAGETPSPDLVAAAGETEGLPPNVAVAWLAAVLVGLAIVAVLAPGVSLTSKLPLENSPEALTRDAQSLLKGFGYTAKPADRAWGLDYHSDYLSYSTKHPSEAAARWKNPAVGQPPLVTFWYRESPRPMPAMRGFDVAVSFLDPPMEASGLVRLQTDLDGKLQQLEAVPPQVEAPPAPQLSAQAFDWGRLFQAAGLDLSRFQATEPRWTPLANWDVRAAWNGDDPQTGKKLRVEAAAWRGKPIFFRIIGPWTVPERMPAPSNTSNQIPSLVVVYLVLIAACGIAWHNFRAGKSDRRGAFKMGSIYFLCMAGARLLRAHHTATLQELNLFWLTISTAFLNAGTLWIIYLALEPWVRRRWPHTIIGWNRLTAKGIGDPLVGRDLLCGTGCGLLLGLVVMIGTAFHGNSGQPFLPPLEALLGMRYEVAGLLNSVDNGLFNALFFLFLLFVLRALLRKPWLAAIVYIAVLGFIQAFGTTTPWVDYPVSMLYQAVFAFILLRFGLVAAISAAVGLQLLESCPATLDFSAWYVGLSLIPPAIVALIALYGFRISLAGRPLIRDG